MRADFRAYRTRDGHYVGVSPSEPAHWERFCRAIEREDLIELYETTTRRQELVGALKDVFESRDRADWVALNAKHNIAVTPVLETIEEIENDPQMVHRELFQEIEYEPLGRVKQVATPFLMSETPPEIRFMPRSGQHTGEVLRELGYADGEIDQLRVAGVCE